MNPHELDLVLTFIQSHPDAAARELELQRPETATELILALPKKQAHRVLMHMLPSCAARLCNQIPVDRAAELLVDGNVNQVAAILRCLQKPRCNKVLKGLPEKTATLCRLVLSYSEDTIGAWMVADIVMLPADCTAADALKRLALSNSSADSNKVPVIDKQQYVIGLVDVRDLLRAKAETVVTALVRETPSVLSSRTSVTAAARDKAWHHHDTLLVLNRNRQLIGLLRHVDLRRSLARFSEVSGATSQNDFLGSIGEGYVGSLSAMLGLFHVQQPASMTSISLGEKS